MNDDQVIYKNKQISKDFHEQCIISLKGRDRVYIELCEEKISKNGNTVSNVKFK